MTTREESPNAHCQEHGGEVSLHVHLVDCPRCRGIFCVPCFERGHTCIVMEDDGTDDPSMRVEIAPDSSAAAMEDHSPHGSMAAGPAVDEATRLRPPYRDASVKGPLVDLPEISVERAQTTLRSGRVVNEHGPDEAKDANFTSVGAEAKDIGPMYAPISVKIVPMEAEILLDVARKIHTQVGNAVETRAGG